MLETLDVDLGVRMAHVANNRARFQLLALLSSDYAFVSRRRYDYINVFDDFIESDNFEAVHALKRINRFSFLLLGFIVEMAKFLTRLEGRKSDRFR
jgi:hypothetical protein